MTSRLKGVINYNFPVEVVVKYEDGSELYHRNSEGASGSMEVDLWFSGNQEVIIREVQKKESAT